MSQAYSYHGSFMSIGDHEIRYGAISVSSMYPEFYHPPQKKAIIFPVIKV